MRCPLALQDIQSSEGEGGLPKDGIADSWAKKVSLMFMGDERPCQAYKHGKYGPQTLQLENSHSNLVQDINLQIIGHEQIMKGKTGKCEAAISILACVHFCVFFFPNSYCTYP